MPAQSGSSAMLKAMGRGYTREAYIELIEHVRQLLPGQEKFLQLIYIVRFNQIYYNILNG